MQVKCLLIAAMLWFSLGLSRRASAQDCAISPFDEAAAAAHAQGLTASPQFRAVVARFDSCHVVVHVVTHAIAIFGTAGTTTLIGAVGEWRYPR